MTDRELMQQALETAEQIASADYRHWGELASLGEFERWARSRANHIAEALRARLAQPENEFNPDLDAIAVMVEEQQRMAKRIEELEARLAQPEQEPVAWGVPNTRPAEKAQFMMLLHSADGCQYPDLLVPLYTAPPQREWVGLTDEEINILFKNSLKSIPTGVIWNISRTIEAKLKEKNT